MVELVEIAEIDDGGTNDLSRRHERLYHGGMKDSITAALETLPRRQERLYDGGRRNSITAARETLSRRALFNFHHLQLLPLAANIDIVSSRISDFRYRLSL